MAGIDSIVNQVVFWIVTYSLNTIIFIWLGRRLTQLLSILSQILPIAKVIFYTFEHINHILGVKINIYQFIQTFVNILYYKMCWNVVFPVVLILSINQGDKTEKNIKTSPSLLPPHNHCEKQGIWSAKYPALISHDKANKTLACKHRPVSHQFLHTIFC